jgi:glycine betaine catabolism A
MTVLEAALAQHRPGHALAREFHLDATIHEHEIESIWRRSWLFAGFSIQARVPGEFFRFDLGDDSILLVRDEAGVLYGLHNTCRHRGMQVCDLASGSAKRWVCPYHQWSYALDGTLLGAGGMERELDLADHGLRRAPVVEVGGLVYVWPGLDEPDPFEMAGASLAGALEPQGLERARIAHRVDYRVRANWKLVWENNRECWHCHVGHPQYVVANFDAAPDNDRSRELAAARAGDHARVLDAVSGIGSRPPTDEHNQPGLFQFPTEGRWWSANRTPLVPGFVTESIDGEPVAPLMGAYPDYDVGTLRVRTVPNMWSHSSADHAVFTRLLPDGPESTLVSVYWLVDERAVEGRDYELDRLLPFWQLTSEQDWGLCERNHAGVRSPAYTPGPYSPSREYNVSAFIDWYLLRVAPV